MKIENVFTKDLFRQINGVVKVDQQDEAVVWQELDEYVVTRELKQHLNNFFGSYLKAIDNPHDPVISTLIGVWVSGFFGSGKSHFIKILPYLLQNKEAHDLASGAQRRASDFFDAKIDDSLLLAEIKRAVSTDTDVILFNIDSKADNAEGRDAILKVFTRVFNEMQGFSGDAPHIADMERYLAEQGVLERFHQAFKENSGQDWLKARDAFLLMRDEVIAALAKALDKSPEASANWFDKAEENFSLTIEGFARRVKEYLERRGPQHRIIFVVDEVGQFIGTNTHLMLSLQTITENLGTICGGRAWIIVTSQEDIDAVLGEIRGAQANDFSKIQGRFSTRLSLSSSNTDEVIQARLLEKTEDAQRELEKLFAEKGDILKNQLSFSNNGATLKNYKDKEDFVRNYPFTPYHFQLVQKIFESIRKAGATGMHLSRGERSMLDAFQSAARNVSSHQIGALVPLYEFYPAIESFLDTAVKRTIDNATDNPSLELLDRQLLRVLFLIRYVDIVKSNVDNLVTLCISEVDADRLELKQRIEESLQRLERETLINQSGDLYFFLTNEERDVSREIKNVDINGSEQAKKLTDLVFDDVLRDTAKQRYQLNKKDYTFNRLCDGQPHGNQVNNELTLEVISPFNDEFQMFNQAKCIGYSAEGGGRVLIKMADSDELGRELLTLLQTAKYIQQKTDAAAPPTLQKILRERAGENQDRAKRLITLLERLLTEGEYYAVGQSLKASVANHRVAASEAQSYLIKNIYTKLGYLQDLQDDPQKEIKATLLSDDIGQQNLQLNIEAVNGQALREVREFIELRVTGNQRVPLNELVARFVGRPYGWPDWEIILLVARLFVAGEIKLMTEGASVEPRQAIEPLLQRGRWAQVSLIKRKTVGSAELVASRNLGQQLFNRIGPDTEDGLYSFLREELTEWKDKLGGYQPLADTGSYPGKKETDAGLNTIARLLTIRDSFEFFEAFNARKSELLDLAEDINDLSDFYTNQRATWEKLQRAMRGSFKDNRQVLEVDVDVKQALGRMDQIMAADRPYSILRETDALIQTVGSFNDRVIADRRAGAVQQVDERIAQIKGALEEIKFDADFSNQVLKPLQDVKKRIEAEESTSTIFYLQSKMAADEMERSLELIESRKPKPVDENGDAAVRQTKTIRPASLLTKVYLENEEEIEQFIGRLRQQLEAALKENARIRIQ